MNILGMGTMEVLVVLVVGFIVLGPQRMVEAARLLGKASRELRRMAEELPGLTLDDSDQMELAKRSPFVKTDVPGTGVSDTKRQDDSSPDVDSPVEFKLSSGTGNRRDTEEGSHEK